MAQLILVKHAMPSIDRKVSAPEWILSDEGRSSSSRLASRLLAYDPDVVLSSEEPKARETASIVAHETNLPIYVVPDLHEHDRRGVKWMDSTEFRAAVRELFNSPSTRVFGHESAYEAYERFRDALVVGVDQHPGRNVVVVTHGTVISLYVSRETGLDPYELWERLGLPSYVVVSWPEIELVEVVDRME